MAGVENKEQASANAQPPHRIELSKKGFLKSLLYILYI